MRIRSAELERLLDSQADAIDVGLDRLAATREAFTAELPRALGDALRRDARAGEPLSATLRAHELLPAGELALLVAAERRGDVPRVLRELARRVALRRARLRGAISRLAYPAFLLAAACLIPPLPRWVGGGLGAYLAVALPPLALLALVLGAAVALTLQPLGSPLRRAASGVASRVPVLAGILRDRARARFLDALGRSLDAGLELREAVAHACLAAAHDALAEADAVVARITRGDALAAALSSLPGLEPTDLALISQGELSGRLPEVLARAAKLREEDAERREDRAIRALVAGAFTVAMAASALAVLRGYGGYLGGR